jgi:Uma2 family endonuclease
MSTLMKPKVTPSEYLELERAADTKNEFLDGEVIPLGGASREHNLIGINIAALFHQQLRDRECEVYGSDMRVKVTPTGLYTYPDVSVVCGSPQFEDAEVDTLLNPTLIVEILSESTEVYDRGEKSAHYRRLPSCTNYLLVAQDRYHIEHYSRTEDGNWLLREAIGPDAVLEIPSLECRLPMSEAYLKVAVPAD